LFYGKKLFFKNCFTEKGSVLINSKMSLPVVSMEDVELFSKNKSLDISKPLKPLSIEEFEKLAKISNDIWWSRLVISVRGFTVNHFKNEDERLFSTDDAFIIIHKVFVEKKHEYSPKEFVEFLNVITSYPSLDTTLTRLETGSTESNPFTSSSTSVAFTSVFGQPNPATYHIANLQKHAYYTFTNILGILLFRWSAENGETLTKRKGIRFDKDPEWQPDDRVVLFEEFYQGNRTWVLTDFDRHIISFWRPKGTHIIFGDRHIEKKKRSGFNLCDYCGMLEQFPQQFKLMERYR
jgi:hypothetical protein